MKHTLFARIACILIALSMALCFVACGTGGNDDVTTTTTTTGENTEDSTPVDATHDANGYLLDQLPADLNLDRTVTMLTWKDVEHEEFFVDDQTGDLVNDAIYKRTVTIEERLGIHFEEILCDGNSDNRATWVNFIQNDNMSASHAFDITAGYSLSQAKAANTGLLLDLNGDETGYLNFENPWWSPLLLEQATINNKLYFASGDISMNSLYMMYVCFVNTDIMAEHNLTDPSTLVQDGKWTYDKFFEYCEGIYQDLNGNGKKDSDDRFGYMSSGIHTDVWMYGAGINICEKDAEGHLKFGEAFQGERTINVLNMVNNELWNTNDCIYTSSVLHQKAFRDEKLLFCMDRSRISFKVLADNGELKYTIVPCPKYDEEQDRYYTVMGNPFTLYGLPADCTDPEAMSAVLECLASESYRITTPAVFEQTLKLKYSQNEISGQMYDLIRDNITYDIGRIYSDALINQSMFRNAISGNATNWATQIKANQKVVAKKIATLEESFNFDS